MDTDWSRLNEPHRRLAWARSRKFPTIRAAAESLGLKEGTYGAYERVPGSSKASNFDHQQAIQFGRKFGVSWEWLLVGQGTPFSTATTEAQRRVLDAMASKDESEQARVAEAVEVLLKTG